MRHYTKHLATLALTALLGILPSMADIVPQTTDDTNSDTYQGWVDNTDGHLTAAGITGNTWTGTTLPQEKFIYINEANFPDAGFRSFLRYSNFVDPVTAIVLKQLAADGAFTDMEIAQITCINVHYNNSSYQIASLQGIEYFTALTELDCHSERLTELDVTQNTALTSLNCSGNQLTELDVSASTALTELNCSNNQLTELDVTQNTALEVLNCSSSNDFSTKGIDLSMNTALKELYCANNQLTEVEVTYNTALETLSCASNQLTELDVTNNTALKYLYCHYNQLTQLDVTKNTALISLGCTRNEVTALDVTNNTALTNLSCDHNQLTQLDLTNNTELKILECSYNQLTKLDVTKNTVLWYFECWHNQLTSLDVSKNTALQHLYCDQNQLVELDLSNNTDLIWVDFRSEIRSITAEMGKTYVDDVAKKFYYFSLDGKAGHGNNMKTLAEKLLVSDHADEWWSRVNKETITGATILEGSRRAAAVGDIDPETIYGTIIVLEPTDETETSASGSMTYVYDMKYTGTSTSVQTAAERNPITLNWTADPQVITDVLHLGDDVEVSVSAVQFVNPAGQVSDTPWQGVNIVVKRHSDGTTTTSKVIR